MYRTVFTAALVAFLLAHPFGSPHVAAATTTAASPGKAAPIVLAEKNLTIDAPPDDWQRSSREVVFAACLEYARSRPEMTFSIIANVPHAEGDYSSDQLASRWANRQASTSISFSVVEKRRRQVDGMDGVRLVVEVTRNKRDMCIVYWASYQPGGSYVLMTSGNQADEELLKTESERLEKLVHVTDRNRLSTPAVAPPPAPVAAAGPLQPANVPSFPYQSGRFPYHMWWKSPGWLTAADGDRHRVAPGADSLFINTRRVSLGVIAAWFGGQEPDEMLLWQLMRLRMQFGGDETSKPQPVTIDNATGYAITGKHVADGKLQQYRMRVFKSGAFAYFVSAMSSEPAVTGDALELAVKSFGITADKQLSTFDPKRLGDVELAAQAILVNELANVAADRSQSGLAITLHERSLELRPDPVVLDNLIIDYTLAQRPRDTIAVARRYPELLTKRPAALAHAAIAEARFGDANRAFTYFDQYFAGKPENDDALRVYATLLRKHHRPEDAFAVVRQYRTYADTLTAVGLESDALADQGKVDAAIKLLRDRLAAEQTGADNGGPVVTARGGAIDLAYRLASLQLQAKCYADAAQTAQTLISNGRANAWAYQLLGDAQLGQKHYREAKAALESAAQQAPGDTTIQNELRIASAMLGEGDNGSIKSPIDPVAIPPSLLNPAAPKDAAFARDANLVYLSRVTAISFVPGEQFRTTEFRSIKALTTAGAESLNTMAFGFDPLTEHIFVNRLEVKDAEGHLVATGNVNDCYAVDRSHEESSTFSKVLNVPVPGLKPGYTVELTVTRGDINPPLAFGFKEQLLAMPYPTAASAVVLYGDLKAVKVVTSAGVATANVPGGGRAWCVINPPQIRLEPQTDEVQRYLPFVWLGDAHATWAAEAAEYLSMVTGVLKPDPEATALAADLTRGCTTDAARVVAILNHVQATYSYKAIEFGRRGRVPNTPGVVIHNRYGDCKDHALLLRQLLNAAGIPAQLALVRASGPVQPGLPSLDQFDHMIVCAPGASPGASPGATDRWFDCTDKSGDLSLGVPYDLAGKDALLLDPANPRLVRIPNYAPDSSTLTVKRDATLAVDGDVKVHETISIGGYFAAMMREDFKHLDAKTRTEAAQRMLASRLGADLVLQDVRFDNLDATDRPFVIDVTYNVHRRFSPAGDRLVGALPAPLEAGWLSIEHVGQRESPFVVHFPALFRTTTTLTLPAGFHCDGTPPPAARELTSPFAHGRIVLAPADGAIREDFAARVHPGHYPAEQFHAYEQAHQDMLAALEQSLVLSRN